MSALFHFPTARRRDPKVEAWFDRGDPLRGLIAPWFARLCASASDIRMLMHDGRPTVCAEDAAFAYFDAHAEHANIGFFFGAFLDDPTGLLEGAGKHMRHVKLRPNQMPDEDALGNLVETAYRDIRWRIDQERR